MRYPLRRSSPISLDHPPTNQQYAEPHSFPISPNATYTRAPKSPAFIPILTGSRERSLTLRSRLLRERRAVEIDVERADLANTRVSERSENVVERLIGNHTVTNVSGLASAVNSGNRGLRSGAAIFLGNFRRRYRCPVLTEGTARTTRNALQPSSLIGPFSSRDGVIRWASILE